MNDKELAQLTIQIQNASNWRGLRRTLILEIIPYLRECGCGKRYSLLTRNKPMYRFHPVYILWMYKVLDLRCGMVYADGWLERNYAHLPRQGSAFEIWQRCYHDVKKDAE